MLKRTSIFVCALCLGGLLLSSDGAAQTRQRRSSRATRRAATSARASTEATIEAGRRRIGDQIKILVQYLYVYGRVSSEIELAEDQARRGNATLDPASIANSKATLQTTLKNIREGLDKLETDLRSSGATMPLFTRIVGVADRAALAEEQVAAGDFDKAGRTLLDVIGLLTEALMH